MDFVATNSWFIALLVVLLLFLIYELYIKPQSEDELPSFLDLEEESTIEEKDKSLDKEVLEAVKMAVKIHREKSNE